MQVVVSNVGATTHESLTPRFAGNRYGIRGGAGQRKKHGKHYPLHNRFC